ncbi:MAG: hypothetical protein F6J90_27495 [Moorea sp. SIOASIH]|nr:hypothetical protein [Moorena sp. SIOASIH]NEO39875.1 hypothetical protein [Moorena sp. SIOASIH]
MITNVFRCHRQRSAVSGQRSVVSLFYSKVLRYGHAAGTVAWLQANG